jgi:hypothetical protein
MCTEWQDSLFLAIVWGGVRKEWHEPAVSHCGWDVDAKSTVMEKDNPFQN